MLTESNYNPNESSVNDNNQSIPESSENTADLIEKESMPDMLDAIWEAEDLGIQGGFMYYYPEQTDK